MIKLHGITCDVYKLIFYVLNNTFSHHFQIFMQRELLCHGIIRHDPSQKCKKKMFVSACTSYSVLMSFVNRNVMYYSLN